MHSPEHSLRNPRILVSLVGVALALLMASLEGTVVGTAMPTVIASLGGIEIYSWVFAAYILAQTVMTPVWGKVADLIGRRPAIFSGMALFIIGSALSGLSQSMGQLIAFRVVQGLGAAALFPVGMTIVADLLTLEQRAKVVGLFSGMWGVASLVGPGLGGYLTDYTRWGWRGCFYVIIPAGFVSAALIFWSYRERFERRSKVKFDYLGTAVLSAALVLLLLLVERGTAFSVWVNVAAALACALLFIWFVRIEQRHPEALLPLGLFRHRLVGVAIAHGFFAMMALIGAMSFLPLFAQGVIGTSASGAGKTLVPLIVPWVLSSIVAGRLVLRFGYKLPVLVGMIFMLIGATLMTRVTVATTAGQLGFDVIFLGLGGGLTMVTMLMAAQQAVARAELGTTTSAVQFARNIGAALGAGIMGALMNWQLVRQLAGATGELARFANHSEIGTIVLPQTRTQVSPASAEFLRAAMAGSLRLAFGCVLAASVIATIVAFFIPSGRAHEYAHAEHALPTKPQQPEPSLVE